MLNGIAEFEVWWGHESGETTKIMRALTDASLAQAVGPEDRTLGRIAWHIITSVPEMCGRMGLKLDGPGEHDPVPGTARAIAEGYEIAARSLIEQMKKNWNDSTLEVEDDMYGMTWKRAVTLSVLISHQIHHRGQMTVLMRQAGLRVPGVYGPAREDWAGMNMKPPEV